MKIPNFRIHALHTKIFTWHKTHKRDLPWRNIQDPYAILVSEFMLQQTQVDRVIPKYHAFLQRYPTIEDLARASLKDVLTSWSGLGYNRRAKFLWQTAHQIMTTHQGIVPETLHELEALPGIGPYIARAILIFAYNTNEATIDTNIRRILLHEFNLPETTPLPDLFSFATQLVPKGKSRDWHNALMDYGSTVLTSKKTGIRALTQQPPFKGSPRWYRGTILRILTQHDSVTLSFLSQKCTISQKQLEPLLHQLQHEHLIVRNKQRISLPR